jgi:hypothetical protein
MASRFPSVRHVIELPHLHDRSLHAHLHTCVIMASKYHSEFAPSWPPSLHSHISTMYFSYWMPPGVSERMWSVNCGAPHSPEYLTLEGHTNRPLESLRAQPTTLGAPTTSPWALAISLGSPQLTVKKCEKTTSSLGMLLVWLEIIARTYHSTIINTHVFSLYCHLCIYIATHLHTIYLDLLQALVKRNWRCNWQWRSSEQRHTLRCHDEASLEVRCKAMIMQTWRA